MDDVDYDRVSAHKWYLDGGRVITRTMSEGKYKSIALHRLVLGTEGKNISHRDGDKLNNTRENLMVGTLNKYRKPSKGGKDLERFWANTAPSSDGCVLWSASTDGEGYGKFSTWDGEKQHYYRAHRWIYQQVRSPIGKEVVVRHTCDTPRCVNPDHLIIGSQADNIQDQVDRKRTPRGPDKPNAVALTWEDVDLIREHYGVGAKNKHLSEVFGVSKHVIYGITSGKTWRKHE